MSWITKVIPPIMKGSRGKSKVPNGVWEKCPRCDQTLYHEEVVKNHYVCLNCSFHMPLPVSERVNALLDVESAQLLFSHIESVDVLKFKDEKRYIDRLNKAKKNCAGSDALLVYSGRMDGHVVTLAVFDFEFMGGSMGAAVGERFAQAVVHAVQYQTPFICVVASGGARLQENVFSLMQMAKTNACLTQLADHKLPFITVLTNPTMGGVSASFAFMGDIVLAEPGALIGFAGPRVIEQTLNQSLPEGFQTAEFLLKKGMIDQIVSRDQLRITIIQLIDLLKKK